jgi:hypothetical protein
MSIQNTRSIKNENPVTFCVKIRSRQIYQLFQLHFTVKMHNTEYRISQTKGRQPMDISFTRSTGNSFNSDICQTKHRSRVTPPCTHDITNFAICISLLAAKPYRNSAQFSCIHKPPIYQCCQQETFKHDYLLSLCSQRQKSCKGFSS